MSIFHKTLGISVFGESHQEFIGITIHNFPSNVSFDLDEIKRDLLQRSSFTLSKSKRTEPDHFQIVSGYFNGKTTGAPLTFLIKNEDVRSEDYPISNRLMRPSHADYTSHVKYKQANDFRGGGHLSGRLTSLYIILGSICKQQNRKHNIHVTSRIASIYDIEDHSKNFSNLSFDFPVGDPVLKEKMMSFLGTLNNDSVGGVVETVIEGSPIGLGDPVFDGVESIISHLIFAIPGVKGIEFGTGFAITKLKGSEANDQMKVEDGKVTFLSNHSGGIQGGITNGEAIIFRTAIKPTPSIAKPLQSFRVDPFENATCVTSGRHDACIVPKAVHVINALAHFAVYDMLLRQQNG